MSLGHRVGPDCGGQTGQLAFLAEFGQGDR